MLFPDLLDYHSSTILQIINDLLFSISPKPTRLIKTPTFPNQYLPCLIILPVISHSETWHFLPLNHSNPPKVFSLLISFFFFKFPNQGENLCPLQWKWRALTTGLLENSLAEKLKIDFSHCFILPQKRWSTLLLSTLNSIDSQWINPWKAQYLIILTSHSSYSCFQR